MGGLGVVCAGFVNVGIPTGSAHKYASQVQAGRFVLISQCPPGKVQSAKNLLELTNHMGVYEHPQQGIEYYEPW
jgi:hypothetical protein